VEMIHALNGSVVLKFAIHTNVTNACNQLIVLLKLVAYSARAPFAVKNVLNL
jgi:hypothetical protein